MPRRRRRIISNTAYEICFRAKDTIPFVGYQIIVFLLNSILARTQRDNKVIICHFIWNGSHVHLIILAKDAQQCMKFYMELKKKITDCLKRLLGFEYLSIWEPRPAVIELRERDDVVDRIAYLYANPAQDDLEDSIEKFPSGLSSWGVFTENSEHISGESSKEFPWVRLPTIPKLKSPSPTFLQDKAAVRKLKRANPDTYILSINPNGWMPYYGIEDGRECAKVNAEILLMIRERESLARDTRENSGKGVMGTAALTSQPILKPHRPKKKGIKIHILARSREIRVRALKEYQDFCEQCFECYQAWLRGEFSVIWPPGAFRPPLPPAYNYIR